MEEKNDINMIPPKVKSILKILYHIHLFEILVDNKISENIQY